MGFAFNLLAYIIYALVDGHRFSIYLLLLPLVIIQFILLNISCKLILSMFHIFLKDLHMLWSIVVLAGFWATPIFYEETKLFEAAPAIKWINPMAGIVVNARNCLFYNKPLNLELFVVNSIIISLLFILGLILFRKLRLHAVENL